MIYLKSLQPLSFDRGPQLPYEAGVERLCLALASAPGARRRRLALDVAFELLRRGRHLDTRPRLLEQEGCIVDLVGRGE